MSFQNLNGNPRENLWISHSLKAGKPKVEPLNLIDENLESIRFIHEWNGHFCFYSGSTAYLTKGASLKPVEAIHDLPSGTSLLFAEDRIYMTLETGATVVRDGSLKTLVEGSIADHSGGFAQVIGMFPDQDRLTVVNRMDGRGEQRFSSHIFTTVVSLKPAIELLSKKDVPGLYFQCLQFGRLLLLTSDKGIHFADYTGEIKSTPFTGSALRSVAVSPDDKRFGGFGTHKGEWSYLEFDSTGALRMVSRIHGRPGTGRVVFDDQGFRYLSSSKRIAKLDAKGEILWTKAVAGSSSELPGTESAPMLLVFAEGGCAYLDAGNLVVLKSDGTVLHAIPIGEHKNASPPYLSAAGDFYIGLFMEDADFIRIRFKQ